MYVLSRGRCCALLFWWYCAHEIGSRVAGKLVIGSHFLQLGVAMNFVSMSAYETVAPPAQKKVQKVNREVPMTRGGMNKLLRAKSRLCGRWSEEGTTNTSVFFVIHTIHTFFEQQQASINTVLLLAIFRQLCWSINRNSLT